ncbi:MAG: DUF2007 domain-containing protein [Bacteroidota bacterium]|nr:DUF2007 domain-containing protein [Bacteroidota bacterium]
MAFTYGHEAGMARSILESEGLSTHIQDELTNQVLNHLSNTIRGVKLYVKKEDYNKAGQILINAGYLKEKNENKNAFSKKLEIVTSKIPLLNKTIFEFRLIIILTLVFTAIFFLLTYKA